MPDLVDRLFLALLERAVWQEGILFKEETNLVARVKKVVVTEAVLSLCVEKIETTSPGSNSWTNSPARARNASQEATSAKSLMTRKPSRSYWARCSAVSVIAEKYQHEVYKHLASSGATEDQQTLPPSPLVPILFSDMRILWSRLPELNRRPSNYESDALPTELSRLRMQSLESCLRARDCTIRMRSLQCQAGE